MATSNSYVFGITTQIDEFFRESFERIGVKGNEISEPMIASAQMSANLALTDWMGKVPLTWMRKRQMITLYQGQMTYQLPPQMTQIIDVIAIQPQRLNTNGIALSSTVASGSAANVFDPNSTAGCTLANPNGDIGYNYGTNTLSTNNSFNGNSIFYVGIQPLNNNSVYKLAVQYSFDGANWLTINTPKQTTYNMDQIGWIVIENSLNAQYWRILETGGATLAIQQLYFAEPINNGQGDRALTALSYTQWMQVSNKLTQSYPSGYFFNSQANPTITLWPVPNQTYTGLLYTGYFYPQDVTYLFNEFDVPRRFVEALVAELAYRLASKPIFNVPSDKIVQLKEDKVEAFNNAAMTDQSNFILSFKPNFSYLGK
tara:strand:- start:3535 stop:4647 length:1113 start_codon:yes stop_codon:yes gene_type:complete